MKEKRFVIPPDTTNLYLWMFSRYVKHKVSIHAGQVSFFLILSILPFFMILLWIVARLPGATEEGLIAVVESIGSGALSGILKPIVSEVVKPVGGIFLFTLITILWSGSKGFDGLAQGLDSIYGTRGKRGYVKRRAFSVIYLLGFVLMILFSFSLIIFGRLLFDYLEESLNLPFDGFFARIVLRYGLIIVLFISFFVMIYRFVPYTPSETAAERKARRERNRGKSRREREKRPKNRSIKHEIPGAFVTATLWILFARIFAIYMNYRLANPSYYGSMASVFLSLLWLYFCFLIIFIGALINSYHYSTGERALPHLVRDVPGLVKWAVDAIRKK